MATAVASGVVALALQQNHALFPSTYLTSHTVKVILDYTAIPLRDDAGKLYDPLTQGRGERRRRGAAGPVDRYRPGRLASRGCSRASPRRRSSTSRRGAGRRSSPGATTSCGVTA